MNWKTERNCWYVDDFIEKQLIPSIKNISSSYHYLSFGLVSIGIEFLGKCLDETHDFDYYKPKLSEKQFKLALRTLFKDYWKTCNKNNINLYKCLKNGFLHSYRPKSPIWLRDISSTTETNHLTMKNKRFTIIIEKLVKDYEEAAKIVVTKIRSGELKHSKVKTPFIRTK